MIRYEFSNALTREKDIHPSNLFNRERILAEKFVKDNPLPADSGIDACPISGLERSEVLFSKWGIPYALCPQSWSLSIASEPSRDTLQRYFENSDLSQFRASEEYQRIVSQTRSELWKGWIEWIEARLFRYLRKEAYSVSDYGPKNLGWTEMLSKGHFVYNLSVESALPPIGNRKTDSPVDVVTLMDVLQRSFEPEEILKRVFDLLKPGGILMGACRSGSGFDILTLRDESDSVFPYDHVSLPSPIGMELILQRTGFETLEVSTPGLFDAQLVKKRKERIPSDQYFQRFLASTLSETGQQRLQSFLQANGLSSHLRFVARKPN